jgi:hypothetical protein
MREGGNKRREKTEEGERCGREKVRRRVGPKGQERAKSKKEQ